MATRLPLHPRHAAAGATFAESDGVEVPLDYGDVVAEYTAVRQAAGLLDRSAAGVLEVTGRDRAVFLHAMLSNDITALGPGRGGAAALLDVHGKVQAPVVVLALEERLLLVTPPGQAGPTQIALDKYLFSEKAVLRDATGELALLLLAGPNAPTLARRLGGADVPAEAWSQVAARIDEVEVRLIRGGGETGEAEVWVIAPAAAGARLWDALVAAGARPVGFTAGEALRIETGTPRWGHDVDPTVLLPEIPFRHLVSDTKGCYLGQEVVVRIRDRGHVNRLLRGLLLEGDTVPAPGDRVLSGGAEVGRITSAAWSFGLKRPVALAFVRRQHAEPGTAVAVEGGGRTVGATVSALPMPR
jgi:folate-binding protein YgfZ